jgi:transcriptional regulator with XRE-family HTH domain
VSAITSIEPEPVKWGEPGDRYGRIIVPMMALALFGGPVGTVSAPPQNRSIFVEIGSSTPTPSIAPAVETVSRVRRVKERSGLTWEQFARLTGVSRRTLHSWDVGATMSAAHQYRFEVLERRVENLASKAESIFDRSSSGASYFEAWAREVGRSRQKFGRPIERVSSSFDNTDSGLGSLVDSTEFDWNEL